MLTAEGATAVAAFLAEQLAAGTIRVGDGEQSASAPIESSEVAGDTVTVRATFAELDANFAWQFREVLDGDELVFDRDASGFGVKVLGAVWTVEVPITAAGA